MAIFKLHTDVLNPTLDKRVSRRSVEGHTTFPAGTLFTEESPGYIRIHGLHGSICTSVVPGDKFAKLYRALKHNAFEVALTSDEIGTEDFLDLAQMPLDILVSALLESGKLKRSDVLDIKATWDECGDRPDPEVAKILATKMASL